MKAIRIGDKVQIAATPGPNFAHLAKYIGIEFEVVDLQHEDVKDYTNVYLRSPKGDYVQVTRTHVVVIDKPAVGFPNGQLVTVTNWEAAPAINFRNLWVVKKETGFFPGSYVYTLRDEWNHTFKVSDGHVIPLKDLIK